MSGKYLSYASVILMTLLLTACGGDENSTPIVNVGSDSGQNSTASGTTQDGGTDASAPESQDPQEPTTQNLTLSFGATKTTIDYTDTDNPDNPTNQTAFEIEVIDSKTGETFKSIENPPSVTISSRCLDRGAAVANYNSSAPSGIISGTYTAESCTGEDIITAFLSGSDSLTAAITITSGSLPSTVTPVAGQFDANDAFVRGEISADRTNLTIGDQEQGTAKVYLKIVDPDNGNRPLIGQENTLRFFSSCLASGQARMDNQQITTETGEARASYTPGDQCIGEDTLYASLNGDNENLAKVTFTNTPVTEAPEPTIEVGSIDNGTFRPGVIGVTNPTLTLDASGQASTDVVVNIQKDGQPASGTDYLASFTSACIDAGRANISSTNTTASGAILATYNASADCLGTDRLTVFLNNNIELKATADINVSSTITPVMGHVDNATNAFVEGEIGADPSDLTIGGQEEGTAMLNLQIVDQNNGNRLLTGQENTVRFFSGCLASGWAQMDSQQITTESGVVRSSYTPSEQCTGEDVLYASLNGDSENLAQVTLTNTPIVETPEPTIEVGSIDASGTFQPGVIRVADPTLTLNALGQASTDIIVNIQSNGQPASGTGYQARFTSMCIDAGRARVTGTNITESGAILATYNASPDCLGTDNLIAFVDNDNELKATANIIVSDTKLALGSYDNAGLFVRNLAATKTTLNYNSEDEPSTDIRSVIAKVDDSGNFLSALIGFESSIELFSTCTNSGLATINNGSTESGELISTYVAQGCTGSDTIYARIAGTETFASTTIDITPKVGQNFDLGYFGGDTFNQGVIGNTRGTALPLGVQTKLFLSIVDTATQERIKGQPLSIQLTSRCGEQPGATASPLSASNASVSLGYVEVLYTAQACGSLTSDLVKAELTGVEGVTALAEATIELADLPANSITAGLPQPNSIAPSWYSAENRETTSTLRVQLKDNQDNGVGGETITFSLDNPGAIDVAVLDPVDNGTTDANGYANVKIKAADGFDNAVFRVVSSYTDSEGNLIQAYSAPIAINSKLPFAEKFSLSTSNFAPDTQGRDGVQVQLSLLAADDQGNRIRGNTVVNFETDQGSIDPECILDENGRCTVTWESLAISAKYAEVRAYTHGRQIGGGTGEIDNSVRMLMSTNRNVSVELVSVDPFNSGEVCARAWVDPIDDGSQNSPPVGTTLEFDVSAAAVSLKPASSSFFTLGSSAALLETPYGFTGCTFVEVLDATLLPTTLTVTATPPDTDTGASTQAFDSLQVVAP